MKCQSLFPMSLAALAAGSMVALVGCTESIAIQEHKRVLQAIAEERAIAEAQDQAAREVLEEERVTLAQEEESVSLEFKHRFENLGLRLARLEKTQTQNAQMRERAFSRQIAESEANVERARTTDQWIMAGLGALGAGIPGIGGVLAALKKAANEHVKGTREGRVNGLEILRDALAKARAADANFDAAFGGKAGDVIRAFLSEEDLNIVRSGNKHKGVIETANPSGTS